MRGRAGEGIGVADHGLLHPDVECRDDEDGRRRVRLSGPRRWSNASSRSWTFSARMRWSRWSNFSMPVRIGW